MNTKILSGMASVAILAAFIGIAVASAASINAENIIITPPELYEQAKELEHFHDSHGVETEVINTTWIYENYEEAEDPPFDGYKNRSFPGKGYNYSLAKKIIAFLNDSATHPNLKYVTLFGNARLVPPSYYIYVSHWTTWDNWIPTDFFYASPDYDFHIEFGVGRLPVNNSKEAKHVVNKIISWYSSLDWNWFKNVAMEGGKDAFSTWDYGGGKIVIDEIETYRGEMSVAYIVNHYLNGMNVTKFYKTDGNFDREHILQSLSGGYGIVYIATWGLGDAIAPPNQQYVDVEDILSLPKITKLPIVISCACKNGAFDTNVYPRPSDPFSTSIGEAILLSNAGGIAYFGPSREAWPDTNFHIDKGYVKIDELLYVLGMLSKIFKAYHEGETFLGDIVKKAMKEFYSGADFSNRYDKATFFEFVFLGDPALELPAPQPGTSYQQPNITALNPDGYKEIYSVSKKIGKLGYAPYFEIGKPITLQITTDSPTISVKVMEDIMSYEPNIVERIENISINGVFNYTFTADKATDYLIRVSTADGKEGWFYLLTVEPEEDTTPPEIIDHSPIGNNVPIDTKISVTFSEAMNKTSVQNAFSISPYVSGSFSWDKNTMFFIPDFNLSYNTTYTITIGTEAEDLAGNNLEAVYSWNFTTAPYNNPPILSPIGNKTVNEGNLLEFTVSASDPDGDNLTYAVSNLPEGASFVNQTFRWTPSYDQAGTYEVTFSVEDGRGGKDTETIFIIVKDVNRAPILAPIGNKTVDEGSLLEFTISASDPDGDALTYSATNLPRGASFVGRTFRWTPDYDQAGTYEVTFIVEDGKGGKDSETIYITVNDVQPEQAEQPELPLGSKDLDSDGLYEDINGDGKLDFDDIVYFQWHYYEDDFQNYKQYYDFDKDGDVDIGDVLELYVFWKWGFWL